MKFDTMSAFYERNKLDTSKLQTDVTFLEETEIRLSQQGLFVLLEDLSEHQLDQVIQDLLTRNQSTIPHFVALMRYFKAVKRNDLFIHLTKYTGSLGVMESILAKVERLLGLEKAKPIKTQVTIPPLGTPLEDMPRYTQQFMDVLTHHLSPEQVKLALADNHHQIPKEAFVSEKVYYEACETLDDYLRDLHERKVKELEEYHQSNRVWYEQEITQEVIDFVRSNQEILSAIRKDHQLFITKIPYDTKAYLEATTIQEKQHHVCHCPFVKPSFRKNLPKVSPTWCNCSGGFTKYPFEVLFDQELEITCIETPLKGDLLCRFVISLEGLDFKC